MGQPSSLQSIDSHLTILGDLSTTGSITVDGVIEGNIYCTSLIIMANGRVNGDIVALRDVFVQGKVTGAICSRLVMPTSSARVDADIFYERIGIERAPHPTMGRFTGQRMSTFAMSRTLQRLATRTPPRPPAIPSRASPWLNANMKGDGHPDKIQERQTRANSNTGGPNWRFSMYDFEQKQCREDALRHECGVLSPGE